MKKALHWLDENLEQDLCVVLLAVFTTILFIQVVMRYVFNNSLSWSEELARYLFIWLCFIGVSFGAKQMKHLKIDVFINVFPKKFRPYVIVFADVIVLVFSGIIMYAAYVTVVRYMALGTASPANHIPMWIVHSAPIVGYFLTAIRQIQAIIFRVKHLKAHDMSAFENNDDEVRL